MVEKISSKANVCYIVRHGESEWNKRGILQGRLDSPLTEKGKEHAEKVGAFLRDKIHVIFASPLGRAQETAQIISKHTHVSVETIPEFAEMDHGICQGERKAEIEERHPDVYKARQADKLHTAYPRGESYLDVYTRVLAPTKRIAGTGRDFAIVAHESANRMIRSALTGKLPADAVYDHQKHDEIVECDLSTGIETMHHL